MSRDDNAGKTATCDQKHEVTECAICLEVIEDRSDTSEGQDSVFCEGECQRWLHRTCAGLTDAAFDNIRRSDECFHCYQCFVTLHKSEIKALRDTVVTLTNSVESLTKELSNLRSLLPSKVSIDQKHSTTAEESIPTSYSDAVVPKETKVTQAQNVLSPHLPRPKSKPRVDQHERKFNLVIFGLDECPDGTPRRDRAALDEEAILRSLQEKIPSFNALSIRDCRRLGKYERPITSSSRPRPILVTMNRTSDVSLVLSTRFPPGNIFVRPDLSPEARRVQSIVRKERRSLIQQGVIEQSAIRIRGNRIYIGERLHGRVIDNDFVKCDSLGDHAPALSSISRSNVSDTLAVSGESVKNDTTSRSATLVSSQRIEAPHVPPVSAPQHPQ